MTNFLRFFTFLIAISLVGCGATLPRVKPYKMDIQQGNVVTSEVLLKLRPGMTKSQVKFIMGTPLLVDSFRTNRWDYFYQLRKQGKVVTQRRVILDFEDDLLKRVRGDVVPKGKTVEDVTKQLEEEAADASTKDEGEAVDSLAPVVSPIETPAIETAEEALEAEKDVAAMPESDASPASILAVPATVEPVIDAVDTVPTEMDKETLTSGDAATPEIAKEASPMPAQEIEKSVLTEPELAPKAEVLEKALAPVVAPVAKFSSDEEAPKEVLIVMPSKANPDKKVFRLDHSLDTRRIIPAEVSESKAVLQESVVKEVEQDDNDTEQDEPGFFERALEKIGF